MPALSTDSVSVLSTRLELANVVRILKSSLPKIRSFLLDKSMLPKLWMSQVRLCLCPGCRQSTTDLQTFLDMKLKCWMRYGFIVYFKLLKLLIVVFFITLIRRFVKVEMEWKKITFGDTTLIQGTSAIVPGLKTGSKYQFRVTALNKVGPGIPSSGSRAVQAKDIIGEIIY